MPEWNTKLEKLTKDQQPFDVGDIVTTPYHFGEQAVRRQVTSVTYGLGGSSSNWQVTVVNVDRGREIRSAICATWFFPYTEPSKQPSKKSGTQTFPDFILKLHTERLAAKKKFRKLRTGEAHLALLAIDSRLAAAVSRFLSK